VITIGVPAAIELGGGLVAIGVTIGVFACMAVCVKPNSRK
jgi:hypothetical protein